MKTIKLFGFSLIFAFAVLFTSNLNAQCPMCKANVESSMKSGGRKTGMGLNSGIYVLLAMPYALVSLVGVLWYVNRKKEIR